MQYDWAHERYINGILTLIEDGMILRQDHEEYEKY